MWKKRAECDIWQRPTSQKHCSLSATSVAGSRENQLKMYKNIFFFFCSSDSPITAATEIDRKKPVIWVFVIVCDLSPTLMKVLRTCILCAHPTQSLRCGWHVASCKVHTLSDKMKTCPHSHYHLILALTYCTLKLRLQQLEKKEDSYPWVGCGSEIQFQALKWVVKKLTVYKLLH